VTDLPMKIATAPVNWNNDDIPGWRNPVPFPDLLDRMSEAGYRATEYDDKIGPEPTAVGAEATKRNLELCGFFQWVDLRHAEVFATEVPAIVERLRQLSELGCRHLVIADRMTPERDAIAGQVPPDGSASLNDNGYEVLAEHADALAGTAREHGFSTHYHNHVGTYVETPDEVERFARHIAGSAVDFCFDTGHFAYGGGDPKAFIEANLKQIGHLHLKDVDGPVLARARAQRKSFRDALRDLVFAPLGQGTAGVREIVTFLHQQRYPGWIVIEQDTCAGDPTATARDNLQFVTHVLNRQEPS
jgi:inosose dehydratase